MAPLDTVARAGPRAVVLGDLVLDLVAILPGQLNYGTDTRCQLFPRPGGSAANTATWLRRLGLPVLYVGRVGADPLGQALVDGLRQEGVDARVARDPEAPRAPSSRSSPPAANGRCSSAPAPTTGSGRRTCRPTPSPGPGSST